jgi:hypothetical protein
VRLGRDADPSPPSSVEVKNRVELIPLFSLRAFVAYERVKPTCHMCKKMQFTEVAKVTKDFTKN